MDRVHGEWAGVNGCLFACTRCMPDRMCVGWVHGECVECMVSVDCVCVCVRALSNKTLRFLTHTLHPLVKYSKYHFFIRLTRFFKHVFMMQVVQKAGKWHATSVTGPNGQPVQGPGPKDNN